jgi:hypothetical protein
VLIGIIILLLVIIDLYQFGRTEAHIRAVAQDTKNTRRLATHGVQSADMLWQEVRRHEVENSRMRQLLNRLVGMLPMTRLQQQQLQ